MFCSLDQRGSGGIVVTEVVNITFKIIFLLIDKSVLDMSLSNVTAVEGDNVTLRCNATGNPAPNITWNKKGNPVVLYQGETYSIVNIRRTAGGDYSCTAWNGVGDKVSASASVTVHCE